MVNHACIGQPYNTRAVHFIDNEQETASEATSLYTLARYVSSECLPDWRSYSAYDFENLVMSGGGSKGYAYIGALKVTNIEMLYDNNNSNNPLQKMFFYRIPCTRLPHLHHDDHHHHHHHANFSCAVKHIKVTRTTPTPHDSQFFKMLTGNWLREQMYFQTSTELWVWIWAGSVWRGKARSLSLVRIRTVDRWKQVL